jgi:precorrin-2 dehydrogenase / sirohydrochlorin ferrochelatase
MPPANRLFFPLWLDLEKQPVLVIGAGRVALRRTKSLIPAKSNLVVIAPEGLPEFSRWNSKGYIRFHQRGYQESDLADQRLVFACTDDSDLNRRIVNTALQRGIWAEGCTPKSGGNMHPGSLVRRGRLSIAISSSGTAPMFTRLLRECLEDLFGAQWGELVEDLAASRAESSTFEGSREADWEAKVRREFISSIRHYQAQKQDPEEI